jgi:hypothetical protein
MTDLLLTLADNLATAISAAAADKAFSAPFDSADSFSVAWNDDPIAALTEPDLDKPLIWIVDMSELLETDKHSATLGEWILAVVFQRKLGVNDTGPARLTACRQLSGLVAEITAFCRQAVLALDDDNGAVCFKTDRKPARDIQAYHDDGLFRTEISTHWRAVL